ncbi:MAG: winged helix-turn-helix domain-containing protein [Bacteroidota bacterium]|nr:MAG: winged helix-turn-helix domain-containing protein [Bacteroidota bacterium]
MGHLAGTTTETSIRVMSEFKKMGIIDTIGKNSYHGS